MKKWFLFISLQIKIKVNVGFCLPQLCASPNMLSSKRAARVTPSVISPNLSLRNLGHYFSNTMFLRTLFTLSPGSTSVLLLLLLLLLLFSLLLFLLLLLLLLLLLILLLLLLQLLLLLHLLLLLQLIKVPPSSTSSPPPSKFPSVGRWSPGRAISMSAAHKDSLSSPLPSFRCNHKTRRQQGEIVCHHKYLVRFLVCARSLSFLSSHLFHQLDKRAGNPDIMVQRVEWFCLPGSFVWLLLVVSK